ncbi:MAG: MGMT family protein [Bacteroidales bacterium]|jgi:methylated-DNA-protein-cysteine methyltransferase-like protein|nr:MGMT family protein [Bacteroidales bacterium]
MTTTNYFETVYQIVRMIPKGRVTTYGAIAACIGGKQGARVVGWALNNTLKLPEALPTHRVVNRNGVLTGKRYFADNSMIKLLESEGIKISKDKIENFKERFWDPMKELSL